MLESIEDKMRRRTWRNNILVHVMRMAHTYGVSWGSMRDLIDSLENEEGEDVPMR